MRLPTIRLSDLSPFGPIFGKELRVTSRRKRNHLLRVVYLGGLLLFLMLVYSEGRYFGQNMGVAARIQQQNQLGQQFFFVFSIFCAISMGLIAPVLTSTAISSERLGKTLPVLLMTPITSWQIVSGKLFSRLLIALMLIGLSLPVLAVVRLLGGVEIHQMLTVVVLCTLFALSAAAVGLFFSTLMNRAYAVILISYATLLFIYAFVPMMIVISLFRNGPGFRGFQLLCAINPMVTLMFLAHPERPAAMPVAWWPCAAIQAGMTLVLVVSSALLLRWFARREGERALPAPPAVVQAASSAVAVTDPDSPRQPIAITPGLPAAAAAAAAAPVRALRHVGENPVLWRELRRPLMGRRWSWVTGALVLGLLLLSYASFGSVGVLDESELQAGYACVFHGLYWLLIAVISATAIAQEKESDTWTVLLASPLSARQIVLGKLLGLSRRMLWPTVLIVFHFTVFGLAKIVSWPIYLLIFWILITFNTVWAVLGTYLSLRMKKVTTAVIINLIVPVVLFVAMPLILVVAGVMLAHNDDWGEQVFWYLPYYYLGEGVDRLCPTFQWYQTISMPGHGHGQSYAFEFVRAAIVVGFAHVLVAALIVMYTVRRFDSMVGRAKQLA